MGTPLDQSCWQGGVSRDAKRDNLAIYLNAKTRLFIVVKKATVSAQLINSQLLHSFCTQARFKPGDVLRRKGQHYRDMFLITDGCVEVDREAGHAATPLRVGAGSPIGEIGFLRGSPATATVTAATPAGALIIDDATLARLERDQPALAADLLRYLGETAEERTSCNLIFASMSGAYGSAEAIDVHLCRNQDMLESAQRLRYDVYCKELGRQSPYADHGRKIIKDDLDDFAHTFIAVEAGETTGTLRVNWSYEGSLGILEELYGMTRSTHHPRRTAVCTKFIVKKSKRGGPTSFKLISAAIRYGVRHEVTECYIDCIPALLPYYKALGFTIAGPKFLHRENGLSHPMMLDLVKHGGKLSSEAGVGDYLKLIVKAQAIKLMDSVRGLQHSSRNGE
jgi:predicted GNAT family N-acyltransferase